MALRIGFTGTGAGMTAAQKAYVRNYLDAADPDYRTDVVLHHGDCIGADAEAHDIAVGLGFRAIIHPPDNPKARAFKHSALISPEKSYLERNDDIVAACDVLLATPGTQHEVQRSGTWYTIRKAREAGKKVVIIYPNGDYAIW